MFFHKTGNPEEDDILICTVTKIQPHSVFVNVNEYGYSGMIHISEIAPGRIRNIRDYVKEGKVIICKVLRVNPEKRQVDLSLRRVSELQRRKKINEMKHEQRAESIIEHVAKVSGTEFKTLYDYLTEKIFTQYNFLFECFEDVVEKNLPLESLGIDKKTAGPLEETIRQRIKPKGVEIKGFFKISTYEGNGIEIIKSALAEADSSEGAEVTYLGGGKYQMIVKAKEYKQAEPILKQAVDSVLGSMKKNKGEAEFVRE